MPVAPFTHHDPDTEDNDSDSVLSDSGEFEQEMQSQPDLHTPVFTVDFNELGTTLQPVSSGDNLSNNTGEHTSPPTSEAMDRRFHTRILLLMPLLYFACSPALSWTLQTTAQVLLAFVLLTLAVRLTSTPPRVFSRAASELGLKQMLEQSQLLLARTQQADAEEEHAPDAQGVLGSSLLVLIVVSLAYLQASGSLQHIVLHMTMPTITPSPVTSSSPHCPAEVLTSDTAGLVLGLTTYQECGSDSSVVEVEGSARGGSSLFSSSHAYIRGFLGIASPPLPLIAPVLDGIALVAVQKEEAHGANVNERTLADVRDSRNEEEDRKQQHEQQQQQHHHQHHQQQQQEQLQQEQQHQLKLQQQQQQKQKQEQQKQEGSRRSRGGEPSLSEGKETQENLVSAATASSAATSTAAATRTATATSTHKDIKDRSASAVADMDDSSGSGSSGIPASSAVRTGRNTAEVSDRDPHFAVGDHLDSKRPSKSSKNNSSNSISSSSSSSSSKDLPQNRSNRGMSVHVGVAHRAFTPYGTGFLRPGENLTFCGESSPRPSLWRRMTGRWRSEARTRTRIPPAIPDTSAASSEESDTGTGSGAGTDTDTDNGSTRLCEAQLLTVSEAGLVVIQPLAPDTTSDPPSSASASASLPHERDGGEPKKSQPSVVWKKNCFPLWRRMVRTVKPLPSPVLAYSFEKNNLTLWKLKKKKTKHKNETLVDSRGGDSEQQQEQQQQEEEQQEEEEDLPGGDVGNGNVTRSHYHFKEWKVFNVESGPHGPQ